MLLSPNITTPKFLVLGLLLPLFLFLSHCGRDIRDNREAIKESTLVDLTQISDQYFIEDKNCQEYSSTQTNITHSGIEQWTHKGLNYFRVDFMQTTSDITLKSPFTSKFNFGGKFTRQCFNTENIASGACLNISGETETVYIAKEENRPKPLKICKNHFEYSTDSYEGVALTTLHSIQQVYRVFQNLNSPQLAQLSPIEVDILPIYETVWNKSLTLEKKPVSFVESDNLFYLPKNEGNKPKIVVIPEPVKASDKHSRYWAMPFAVAHELGHHFHRSLETNLKVFSPVSLNLGQEFHRYLSAKNFSWFKNSIQTTSLSEANSWSKAQMQSLALFLASISEGVADLFAYYTLGKNDRSITLIKGLGVNRQVSSSLFSSNSEKTYHAEALAMQIKTLSNEGCEQHPLCQYHIVGAIHAHAFEKIVSKYFTLLNFTLEPGKEQEFKLTFLKTWFEEVYLRANSKKFWQDSSDYNSYSVQDDYKNSIAKIILDSYFQSFQKFLSSTQLKQESTNNLESRALCSTLHQYYPSLNVYDHKRCR